MLRLKTNKSISAFLFSLIIMAASYSPAEATLNSTSLTGDLNNLILDGNQLIATMVTTNLNLLTATSTILSLEAETSAYNDSVQALYEQIIAASGTTMSLSDEMLIALQTLSSTQATLAQATLTLSNALMPLALATMDSSFYAMLRLADDIGTMANRILEMADKILVMADNIGLMADRILATQVIQGTNIELTYRLILQTQQNMLTLFSMFQ
jgi:hypothetical protein